MGISTTRRCPDPGFPFLGVLGPRSFVPDHFRTLGILRTCQFCTQTNFSLLLKNKHSSWEFRQLEDVEIPPSTRGFSHLVCQIWNKLPLHAENLESLPKFVLFLDNYDFKSCAATHSLFSELSNFFKLAIG